MSFRKIVNRIRWNRVTLFAGLLFRRWYGVMLTPTLAWGICKSVYPSKEKP